MGIKDKATYGEYYWAMQVEAAKQLAEESEEELARLSQRLISSLRLPDIVPDELAFLLSELEAPAGQFLTEVGGRFVSEVADGMVSKTTSPLMESIGYLSYMKWPTKKLTPDATAQLYSRKKISDDFFYERLRMGGFEPTEARFQFDAMRPYPSIPDLVLYSRYHGDPRNVWGTIQKYFDVDAVDFKLWEWLGLQRLTTMQVQTLYRRGLITSSEALSHFAEIGWSPTDSLLVQELGWTMPNAMLLVQGDLMQEKSTAEIIRDISIADINPKYAHKYYDAILTKPASADLVAYELRRDPELTRLPARLRQIGIHPDFIDTYKTLAYPIPPVADIITMAVREAFTPAIAERFGQYQDYPKEFEYWAERKGLSKEWSKRYWASHWSLPSALQGFEMLHRGAINFGELDMLLRALDVMPFWRDKLTKIAYRRLTRVDIRRMYKAGVLTVKEVYESYIEHGYTEKNAKRMTDFTVQWAAPKEASITRSDILTAYKGRMISRTEASGLLEDMGEEYFHREFMLTAVDYKKGLELTQSKISGIRNLYKRKVYTADKTRDELLRLDLPAEEVDTLMEQWYFEVRAEIPRHWTTAQTLSFIKAELITKERGEIELFALGYDTEHIDVYMRSIE